MQNLIIFIAAFALCTLVSASDYGDFCNHDGNCTGTYQECVDGRDNSGQYRCLCEHGYIDIYESGATYCGELQYEAINAACATCETNDGICYLDDGSARQCLCPSTRSGAECATSNVDVICDVVEFEMVVCYTPHASMTFNLDAVIHTDGFVKDPACVGISVTSDSQCGNGYKISLPLNESESDRCGVQSFDETIHRKRYEVLITAHNDRYHLSQEDILFKTYCSFETYAERTFQALGVISIGRFDKGEHKAPTLDLEVLSVLGTVIPSGIPLRLGDKISLKITLDQDGTYEDLRVVRCTASTKPTIPDPKAITVPLISDSCPYAGQSIITTSNMFGDASAGVTETGIIKMFKMAQGNTVHLHCVVKLCLGGSAADCDPVTCGSSRRKRSALEMNRPIRAADVDRVMEVTVHSALLLASEDVARSTEGAGGSSLMIILGLVGAVMLTLALVSVLLYRNVIKKITTAHESCAAQSNSNVNDGNTSVVECSSWSVDSGLASSPSSDVKTV